MKKILFISHSSIIGGAEISLFTLIQNLDKSKFDISIILFEDGPFCEILKQTGYEPIVIKTSYEILKTKRYELGFIPYFILKHLILSIPNVLKIKKIIRNENPNYIHTNTIKAHILGGIAGKISKKPIIWHFRDYIKSSFTKRIIDFFALWLPNLIITNSNFVASQFPIEMKNKIITIYNGFDFSSIENLKEPNLIKKELEININEKIVGIFSRIDPWKGHEFFIEFASKIIERFPNIKFIIAGNSTEKEKEYELKLKSKLEELGIKQFFLFIGFKQDVLNYINCVDIVVNPSIEPEPFGRVVMEAMALGKTVVATKNGGPSEIIANGINGFLISNLDPSHWADTIIELLLNEKKREIIGKRAKKHIFNNFNIEQNIKSIEKIYSSLD